MLHASADAQRLHVGNVGQQAFDQSGIGRPGQNGEEREKTAFVHDGLLLVFKCHREKTLAAAGEPRPISSSLI